MLVPIQTNAGRLRKDQVEHSLNVLLVHVRMVQLVDKSYAWTLVRVGFR